MSSVSAAFVGWFPVVNASRRSGAGRWRRYAVFAALAAGLLPGSARASGEKTPEDEFSPLVKLAPFVVNGQPLTISIYARSNADRRYGEKFAEAVIRVVTEGVTESTGRGLVIIGAKGEPHPVFIFRRFLALAQGGQLDPAVAARSTEVSAMLERWEHMLDEGRKSNANKRAETRPDAKGHDLDFDFDQILTALPLPLAGIGAKLYQLAWEEKFDEAKIDAKLRALAPGDLERRDLFKSFDWVFYLPPKGAFDQVLDDLIAQALKQEEVGFFARMAVKSALLVVKPKIRRAIEAMRQAMMFSAVVKARTPWSEQDVSALTNAYIGVALPGHRDDAGAEGASEHERAVRAVRAKRQQLEARSREAGQPAAAETPSPAVPPIT